MFMLLQKLNRAANQIAAFFCNVSFLLMCAFMFLLSAWRVVLTGAVAVAFVFWIWNLVDGFAAVMAALAFILVGFLLWLANYFRI